MEIAVTVKLLQVCKHILINKLETTKPLNQLRGRLNLPAVSRCDFFTKETNESTP